MKSVYDRVLKTSDGTHLHYRIHKPSQERPPTILFIHGLGSNRTRWKRMAETDFLRRSRLIIPDLRGHGDSVTRNRTLNRCGLKRRLFRWTDNRDRVALNIQAFIKRKGKAGRWND